MFKEDLYNQKMIKTFDVFLKELASLRTGRANASMLAFARPVLKDASSFTKTSNVLVIFWLYKSSLNIIHQF